MTAKKNRAAPDRYDKASVRALLAVLAAGTLSGLWGIGWGLPGPRRLRAFPESVAADPATAQKLADGWARLYAGIRRSHDERQKEEPVTYLQGFLDIPPGWTWPPDPLVNSLRSFLLQSVSPDEKKSFIILSQMRPWKLDFKPLYIQYGGAFIYPLGAYLKALSWTGAVTLVPDMRHYLAHPEDMGRLYLAGRILILLVHLGTLALLFDLGRRLSGWPTGLAAALVFALCPLAVLATHIIKPHSYAAFFALLAIRWMLLAEPGRRREYVLCGAAAGLAAGANLTLAPLLGLPVLAALLGPRKDAAAARSAAWGVGAGLIVCLGLNPYLLFSYKDFAWETQVYAPPVFSAGLGRFRAMAATTAGGLGPLLAALAFAGALSAPFRKGRRALALVFWGPTALLWLRFSVFAEDPGSLRLYYSFAALACLLGVDLLASAPRAVRLAALAFVLVDTAPRGAVYLENMRLDSGPRSTRAQAADWIEASVPAGSTIGLVRFPDPFSTPPFRYDRYRLALFQSPEAIPPGRAPQYIVVNDPGRALVDNWAKKDYDEVAQFVPLRAGWAAVTDRTSFVNGGMFVYRRKS